MAGGLVLGHVHERAYDVCMMNASRTPKLLPVPVCFRSCGLGTGITYRMKMIVQCTSETGQQA
uniref:Uncharacterized protein n=1 Tax=Arundo donax TaxID=35708 RepID=A0A0A9F9V2_ARUDO